MDELIEVVMGETGLDENEAVKLFAKLLKEYDKQVLGERYE